MRGWVCVYLCVHMSASVCVCTRVVCVCLYACLHADRQMPQGSLCLGSGCAFLETFIAYLLV